MARMLQILALPHAPGQAGKKETKGFHIDTMERNLTSGSVLKNMLWFSLPYFLSYFLQTLYGMADLYIIGQFEGVAATTAVSVGSQLMHMVTVVIVGLAMGTTVCVGRAVGAQDKKRAATDIGNTVVLFAAVALALTAVLLVFVRQIVSLMSTPEEAADGTSEYLTICFIGIPSITAYNLISSIFRGMGDSRSPMYFVAIACCANIALDYLFIGALGMGPSGAALGTTLSQTISVSAALCMLPRLKSGIKLKGEDFRPRREVMGQLLKNGVPIAFQDGLIQVAFLVITVIANRRGLNDAAAVGIVEKIITFLFLVPSALLATVSAVGAQNIGAGKPERAVKTLEYAVGIAVIFGLIVGIAAQFVAEPVVSLFTDADDGAEVIRLGGEYLRGYIWDCLFAGIHFSFSGYFCAIGKSWLSFLHNICAIVLARIPLVYLASVLYPDTLLPMGLATVSGSLLSVIVCVTAFAILRYQEKKAPQKQKNM